MRRIGLPAALTMVALSGLILAPSHSGALQVQEIAQSEIDLTDYKTVESAITAKINKSEILAAPRPALLGVHTVPGKDKKLAIDAVQPSSPAALAGLLDGDVILKAADVPVHSPEELQAVLHSKAPGDSIEVEFIRTRRVEDGSVSETSTLAVTLAAASQPLADEAPKQQANKGQGAQTGGKGPNTWKKPVYRLAAIPIEFTDVKHNEVIEPKSWEDSLFSEGIYSKKSATGQNVFGSVHDFYRELSYGTLDVQGKVFTPIAVSKKRLDYDKSPKKTDLLFEALDTVLARDGKDALAEFDGLFFIYCGDRAQVARGSLYWPHKGTLTYKNDRWNYFIVQEGGDKMTNISVICHEFGHMLGLPDLYAAPERPGSEGVGAWCLMSSQAPNGRPQHMSAWCKEQLGWLKPTVINPTVKQKLILSPIYTSPRECFKVLLRPDGSEYFLLENRTSFGFDAALSAHGLLIWRVIGNRPLLEESHGVTSPLGPRVYASMVPYPSKANDAFTPLTIPSSRSHLGEGLPVNITNIRKLPDGRITFAIGWEFF